MNVTAVRGWRVLCLPLFLLVAGCHSSAPPADGNGAAAHAFAAQGVIEKIAPDHRQVTIHHQTIPGYMIEMTMDFPVDHPADLDGLVPGDKITFTLNVTADRDWVNTIHRIGHVDLAATNAATAAATLKPGDPMPDGDLLAEDGRTIHLADFRGKAVALTFFFTRCPLPNYCPLMNRNFALTRDLLLAAPHGPQTWQFLSISFDSDFDKAATLASYGNFYRHHNADRWLFAAAPPATLAALAPPLGLVIMRQESNISHNLRTIVIDPQGRLYRQFNDNLWTPQQLADALSEAAAKAGGQTELRN